MRKPNSSQTRSRGKSLYIAGLMILLAIVLVPHPYDSATALDDAVRWSRVNIPTEGEAGKWTLAEGSDIRCPTMAGDGTLYAFGKGLAYTLYKSQDGGVSWSHIGNVQDEIVDIAVAPHDSGNIYYATKSDVYRSTDSGASFHPIATSPGGAGANNIEITSIDVARYENNIVAVGTRDTDGAEFGDVYILDEADSFSGWTPTNIGDYDVYAAAFSPRYTSDFQLIAIVTDEIDTFAASRSGSLEWNALTGMARLGQDNTGASVVAAAPAAVTFPENYDSSSDSPNSVYYIGIDTVTGEGDVYEINCTNVPYAIATDLNAGYAHGPGNLDITGLAAAGPYPDVSLLAGASDSSGVYLSSDGGVNWEISRKEPTGETQTYVLMAPDFTTTGLAYAASSGGGSAFSASRDKGNTWNQLSFIDDTIITMIDMAPSPRYDDDATLFLITFGIGHSLWRSSNGGHSWERVLSTDPADADVINRVGLPPQYGDDLPTVFVTGESNGQPTVWKSTDNGQSYRRRYSHDPDTGTALAIDTWAISDENTLFAGGFNGTSGIVYKTINSGFFYSQAAPAGNQPLHSLVLSPDYPQDGTLLAGNMNGWVYYSENDGLFFQSLPSGAGSPPLTGTVTVAFDPDFAMNNTVYAASDTADSGIYRFVIGESTSWGKIDVTLPADATLSQVIASSSGVLYASNSKNNGGMERCLNPTASSAVFETVTRGLDSDASLGGLWLSGRRLWSIDTVNSVLLTYNDTLTSPVDLVSPENGAPGAGKVIDNTIRNVTIVWETLEGAASYQWRCDNDNDFSSVPDGFEAVTPAISARLPALEPDTTYYWQVRVSTPVTSPWSEKRTFTTTMTSESTSVKLEIPFAGSSDVPVKPILQWSAIDGANSYELIVSPNADFSSPVIVKQDDYALTSNAWQCDVRLDNDTTYYWKVRGVSTSTNSGWSAAGAFTTGPLSTTEPAEEPEETEELRPLQFQGITPDTIFTGQQVTPPEMQVQPPTPPAQSPPAPTVPHASQSLLIQDWTIYLIGGLVATIMFALIIILVMVLKMRKLGN